MVKSALDSLGNAGPHGLTEILYAFASTNANNGSAFAGLSGNTPWFNTTLGLAMFLGRFAYVIPVLALAVLSPRRRRRPPRQAHSRRMAPCSSACCSASSSSCTCSNTFPLSRWVLLSSTS